MAETASGRPAELSAHRRIQVFRPSRWHGNWDALAGVQPTYSNIRPNVEALAQKPRRIENSNGLSTSYTTGTPLRRAGRKSQRRTVRKAASSMDGTSLEEYTEAAMTLPVASILRRTQTVPSWPAARASGGYG